MWQIQWHSRQAPRHQRRPQRGLSYQWNHRVQQTTEASAAAGRQSLAHVVTAALWTQSRNGSHPEPRCDASVPRPHRPSDLTPSQSNHTHAYILTHYGVMDGQLNLGRSVLPWSLEITGEKYWVAQPPHCFFICSLNHKKSITSLSMSAIKPSQQLTTHSCHSHW